MRKVYDNSVLKEGGSLACLDSCDRKRRTKVFVTETSINKISFIIILSPKFVIKFIPITRKKGACHDPTFAEKKGEFKN